MDLAPTIVAAPPDGGLGPVADTVPYVWPWTGSLVPARAALVIAGADPWWIRRSHDAATVAGTIDELAAAVRAAGALVVHVHHGVADGTAVRVAPEAPVVDPADVVVRATGIDGFFGSSLDTTLRARGIDTLVLAGFGLEAPVHSTMRSANDQGYECLLLTDACAPLDPATRDAALAIVTMSGGIFGAIGPTAALLATLRPHPTRKDQP